MRRRPGRRRRRGRASATCHSVSVRCSQQRLPQLEPGSAHPALDGAAGDARAARRPRGWTGRPGRWPGRRRAAPVRAAAAPGRRRCARRRAARPPRRTAACSGRSCTSRSNDRLPRPQPVQQGADRDPPQPGRDLALALVLARLLPHDQERVVDDLGDDRGVAAPPAYPGRQPRLVPVEELVQSAPVTRRDVARASSRSLGDPWSTVTLSLFHRVARSVHGSRDSTFGCRAGPGIRSIRHSGGSPQRTRTTRTADDAGSTRDEPR